MKAIVYRVSCNNCSVVEVVDLDDAAQPESSMNLDVPLVVGEQQVTLDLCDDCMSVMLDELSSWLERANVEQQPVRKVKKHPTPAAPATANVDYKTCKVCGLVSRNRSALGQHGRDAHGIQSIVDTAKGPLPPGVGQRD